MSGRKAPTTFTVMSHPDPLLPYFESARERTPSPSHALMSRIIADAHITLREREMQRSSSKRSIITSAQLFIRSIMRPAILPAAMAISALFAMTQIFDIDVSPGYPEMSETANLEISHEDLVHVDFWLSGLDPDMASDPDITEQIVLTALENA